LNMLGVCLTIVATSAAKAEKADQSDASTTASDASTTATVQVDDEPEYESIPGFYI